MGLSETLESVYYPGISGLELRVIDERTAGRRKSDEIGQVFKGIPFDQETQRSE